MRVRPRRGCTRSASEVARSRLRSLPHANLRGLPHAPQSHPRFFTTTSLSGSSYGPAVKLFFGLFLAACKAEFQPPIRAPATATAAAAAAVLLLLLLLLHDPRCIAEHKPSQQTVSRFVFFGTHAEASNGTGAAAAAAAVAVAAAAAQQVHQQGKPKHMYEYIYFFILRRMGKNKA